MSGLTFYHATFKRKLPSIHREGLLVACSGENGYVSDKPYVFITRERGDAHEYAFCSGKPAAVLTLTIPDSFAAQFVENQKVQWATSNVIRNCFRRKRGPTVHEAFAKGE